MGCKCKDKLDPKDEEIKQLKFQLLMMAKLAADEPMFCNPLEVFAAKQMRDDILEKNE